MCVGVTAVEDFLLADGNATAGLGVWGSERRAGPQGVAEGVAGLADGALIMGTIGSSQNDFENALIAIIPSMRAFARSLCGDQTRADDLVQEALAKALRSRDSFQMGTNLKAWTFQIVRNQYFSEKRRDWRWCALEPTVAEATLVGVAQTDGALELDDVRQALNVLSDSQREALILVGAGGLSYEEAAEIMGVAIGTVKSRVGRARMELQRVLETGAFPRDNVPPSGAMGAIMSSVPQMAS